VDGDKNALKDINPSVDNLVKGIVGAAGESAKSIGKLRGDITDLSSPAPTAKEALETLSKALSGLDDNSTKMAVAARFLGRTITQDFLNVLSNPEKLKEFQERVEHLGIALNDTDKAISEKFREALFTLQNDIGLVADKMGTAFGPGFTTIVKALDDALIANKDSIIRFAEDIAGKAVPVVESFIRVLSGAPDAAKDEWLTSYTDKIGQFGQAVGRIAGIFTQVVGVIVQASDGIAQAINGIFGSNLNGFDVLLGAWVAKIVLNFAKVIQASTLAAAGIEVALAPVLGFMAVLASSVYVVVKALSALSDAFGLEGQSSHLDAMLEGAQKRLKAIGEFMSGDFQKGIKDWKDANEEQQKAEEQLDDIDKQITNNRKKRQNELTDVAKDSASEMADHHKTSLEKIDDDHKKSVETRVDDLHKLADEAVKTADVNKKMAEDNKKAAQSEQQTQKKLSDGSTIDENGIRTFPGASGLGGGGLSPAQEAQFQAEHSGVGFGRAGSVQGFQEGPGQIQHPLDPAKLGEAVKQGAQAGTSQGLKDASRQQTNTDAIDKRNTAAESTKQIADAIDKRTQSAPLPQQQDTEHQLSPPDTRALDNVQDALDKWRAIGGELGGVFSKLEPEAANLLKKLSDRSDGSQSGVKPASAEQLQQILDNQRKITDFEQQQQKGFGQGIAKQGGFPSPDQANTSPPVQGSYDQNGNFVPNKVQPPPPVSQGAPNPLSFPNYLKDLQDQLSKVPLPAADPRKVDTNSQAYKAQEDTTAKGVERGIEAANQKQQAIPINSDSLNHARSSFGFDSNDPTRIPRGGIESLPPNPADFPQPVPQEPLAPDLQPFKDLTDIGDKLTSAFEGGIDGLKGAFDNVVNGLQKSPVEGQGLSDTTFQSLEQGIQQLIDNFSTKQEQQPPQSDTPPPPVQDLTDLGNEADGAGTQLADLKAEAAGAGQALAALQAAAAAGGAGGGSADVTPIAAAGGGHIWGPGTETSDSIPALLSKNEFVHPAYAVRHYGLQFMEDIRHLRLPKFNAGGLVGLLSPQLPRFSTGGIVSPTVGGDTSAPVPVDLRTDHGTVRVQAQKAALSQLQRAATTKRLTSTTKRRPEFVS
jgi:hypothetical protein